MGSNKGIIKEITADPGGAVTALFILTTEFSSGLELARESAKNLCQEMFNQSLPSVCVTAFFPVLLAAERLFDVEASVRQCKTPSFPLRTALLKTEKILLKKPTVFNLQGQVLLQQPQQSCDTFHRLTTAPFRKQPGECRESSCPAAEACSGIFWLQTFVFPISASFPALHHSWPSLQGANVGHLHGCSPAEKGKLSCAAVWKGPPKDTADQILDLKLLGFRNEG